MDGEHVAWLQHDVGAGVFILNRATDVDCDALCHDLLAVLDVITCEIGGIQQCASLKPSRHPYKLRRSERLGQWIPSGSADVSVNYDTGHVGFIAPKEPDRVERLQVDGIIPNQDLS